MNYCKPNPICLSVFTYKAKGNNKQPSTISEQRTYFNKLIINYITNNDPNYQKWPKWFLNEFCSYWNQVPDLATKTMFFLLTKKDRMKWSTGGRLAYCKRTFFARDPRWKTDSKPSGYKVRTTQGNYGDIDYEKAKQNSISAGRGNIGSVIRKRFEK